MGEVYTLRIEAFVSSGKKAKVALRYHSSGTLRKAARGDAWNTPAGQTGLASHRTAGRIDPETLRMCFRLQRANANGSI